MWLPWFRRLGVPYLNRAGYFYQQPHAQLADPPGIPCSRFATVHGTNSQPSQSRWPAPTVAGSPVVDT